MLKLVGANDSLELVTSAAATVDVLVDFMDASAADPPVVKGSTSTPTLSAITTATVTTICANPGASVMRNIKTVHIRNKHASLATDVTVQFDRSATNFELFKVTLAAGDVLEYVEGIGWFSIPATSPGELLRVLSGDDTGTNVATAQPWFPTLGTVAVAADTLYKIDGHLYTTRAAGATSHTTGLLFAGTATLTGIMYTAKVQVGDTEALLPTSRVVSRVATNTTCKAASTSTTETVSVDMEGYVRVNAAGTFIPQFIYSAAPGGVPTIKANSSFRLTPCGSGSFASQGVWT